MPWLVEGQMPEPLVELRREEQRRRAAASGDRVQAQFTGVDVPAGERAGEAGREVRCPGY